MTVHAVVVSGGCCDCGGLKIFLFVFISFFPGKHEIAFLSQDDIFCEFFIAPLWCGVLLLHGIFRDPYVVIGCAERMAARLGAAKVARRTCCRSVINTFLTRHPYFFKDWLVIFVPPLLQTLKTVVHSVRNCSPGGWRCTLRLDKIPIARFVPEVFEVFFDEITQQCIRVCLCDFLHVWELSL